MATLPTRVYVVTINGTPLRTYASARNAGIYMCGHGPSDWGSFILSDIVTRLESGLSFDITVLDGTEYRCQSVALEP